MMGCGNRLGGRSFICTETPQWYTNLEAMRSCARLSAESHTSAGSLWLRTVNSARKALTRAGLGTTTSLFEMLSKFNMNWIYGTSQYRIDDAERRLQTSDRQK